MSIVKPVIIIGIITFFVSLLGIRIGQKIGHFFENRIEVLGGLILILIGFKILLGY
jgi:putative Mn2+ efflux pump MntP